MANQQGQIMYLGAATENKASTALDFFLRSLEKYGVPDRVRADQGCENVDIARWMFTVRGCDRGSLMAGKSVHNQRIECLWRDLWMSVTIVGNGPNSKSHQSSRLFTGHRGHWTTNKLQPT
ncbi:hypothetical protein MATL_G00101650 [Megalops atlanticus]|uniref:Integrase core domain-containing protein n=1 Tax=Megalops atlanticus TaxID=7932 RepID=A0A9D3Q745_MEGAT|nr:hypothetical protein MATL_G00101650 [Megalops atlanticus]